MSKSWGLGYGRHSLRFLPDQVDCHFVKQSAREWTREIERSQRGRATIVVTQEKPEAEVPAEHVST
ncbi:hypothetical protein VP01_1283g8 [Puccinia sorghi]|uniref:Uncharacterized protein n=1 Tax=Puccinia sorghi TaxID=27349 RepID=A0A0L6VNQ5_9BASI|nr:hypothetical protein VP01_1283g8 [Puccinia sorghi]